MPGDAFPPTYRAPRLFVETDLAGGQAAALSRDQARYLQQVMRRGGGAAVIAFNGRDGEWLTRLEETGRREAMLTPERRLRPQPPEGAGPWLAFALVKRGPVELIVEKATELGAARLLPLRTERANADRINSERLRRIAVEAAEQCGRLDVPEIAPLAALAEMLGQWPRERRLLVGDETGAAPPLLEAADGLAAGPFGLLVGPEGGFAPGELDALSQLDFALRIGLGPRVLRSETAVIAGLALAQAAFGDFAAARQAPG